jgi:hypothetical protein
MMECRNRLYEYSINHKGTETKKDLEEEGMIIRIRKRHHSLYHEIKKMMRKRGRRRRRRRRRKEIIILQY